MNIFVLDQDPIVAAKYMCDKHNVKMILESCQLLCTAHRVLDGHKTNVTGKSGRKYTRYVMLDPFMETFLYKSTMVNHPCSIWTRENSSNYHWLATHNIALLNEYTVRYGKNHICEKYGNWLLENPPRRIKNGSLTPFALAMPDQYKCSDSVLSYRNYYINEKHKFAKWKTQDIPDWYSEGIAKKHELVAS